ncbi:hypothetical protein [Frankia nepalensis]|nr:hypothetical protein [Frankia nepalensis]
MPAGSGGRVGAAAAPWKAWVEERRRPVIAGAFVLAALLGVVIGLVTAPDSKAPPETGDTAQAAPARSPQLPPLPWANSRSPGTATNLTVGDDLRPALTWAAADDALAKADKPTLSEVFLASGGTAATSASPQGGTQGAALTQQSITIPAGKLYYGAVQGSDATLDEFWAVGVTETPPGTPVAVPGLHVWKRVGSGPWTVVATGAGACDIVPQNLFGVGAWTSRPPICDLA